MHHILVVEDDPPIAELIKMHLELAGYGVSVAEDGPRALEILQAGPVDLALLDIMLPGMNGLQLMEKVKPMGVPVIFLTAKNALTDRVHGLRAGAEDYIVKPFEALELLARVEVVLRRCAGAGDELSAGGLVIDRAIRKVSRDGAPIDLTLKEYDLLMMLLRYQKHILTRERILEEVWGFDFAGETRTVDIHIQKLRRKLGWAEQIKTVYKIGYRLELGP